MPPFAEYLFMILCQPCCASAVFSITALRILLNPFNQRVRPDNKAIRGKTLEIYCFRVFLYRKRIQSQAKFRIFFAQNFISEISYLSLQICHDIYDKVSPKFKGMRPPEIYQAWRDAVAEIVLDEEWSGCIQPNCIRAYFSFSMCVVCVRYLLVRYRHKINHRFKAVSHTKRGKK